MFFFQGGVGKTRLSSSQTHFRNSYACMHRETPVQSRAGQATCCWYSLPDLAARRQVYVLFTSTHRDSVLRHDVLSQKKSLIMTLMCTSVASQSEDSRIHHKSLPTPSKLENRDQSLTFPRTPFWEGFPAMLASTHIFPIHVGRCLHICNQGLQALFPAQIEVGLVVIDFFCTAARNIYRVSDTSHG